MRRVVGLLLLAATSVSLAAGNYYPSAPGTTWKLSNGEVQRLLQPQTLRGVKVTPLQHLIGGKLVSEDLLEFRDGAVYLRATRSGGKLNWYEPPLTVYPASPLTPGQSWTSSSGGLTLTARVMGQEALSMPAGRFNALVIRNDVSTSSGAASSSYSYFVPGIGTVRYSSGNGSSVDLVK
ncbi:hypothetical protein [Deinococcus peraridilitoris]|uniref:Uncharacterized protein n=1 Tax=Deinococcus peraridilitoris (strain DSM 19664 / LMG 22246 / CIP 109416 / KR-200) TaxID=937777 RepID=L0A4U0_DEIPD|nr:hypothetical protein [Deinococcus peraridilitoris]AFZ68876.1 hypothetical protein Deipe_3443 [Deinococcus peraridilitoris DSM 19664]